MNVIDALKALGKNERFARDLANKEKLIAMGIDPRNIFLIHWDGNPRNPPTVGLKWTAADGS